MQGSMNWVENHWGHLPPGLPVRINDAVHVLHACQKKSRPGIATLQPDVKSLKSVI